MRIVLKFTAARRLKFEQSALSTFNQHFVPKTSISQGMDVVYNNYHSLSKV